MRSLGYDNITFIIHLSSSERKEIQKLRWDNKTRAFEFISEKIYFEPKGSSTFLCNINAPKLINDHNITLATPEILVEAIKKCKRLSPVPLDLLNAPVQAVHFTYIQDTPLTFASWSNILTKPKYGKWDIQELPNGIYFNGSRQRTLFYLKDEQLNNKGRLLPRSVTSQCEYEHLIRAEIRFDRSVRKQLSERGLCPHKSLIGSDLCSPEGFLAFVEYFQWRVLHCIKDPKEKHQHSLSGLEQLALLSPKDFIKFCDRQLKNGKVDELIIALAKDEIIALEINAGPKQLIFGIRKEYNYAVERYSIRNPIIGELKEVELKVYAGS